MRVRVLLGFLLLTSLAAAQRGPRPLVVVSWDGGADWVMDRLIAEGKLPNVSKLIKEGVRAEYSTPAFPSKTAVSHVSIFTGTTPATNGVTGNSVPLLPRSAHTILETRSGFDANSNSAEPLWVTAAKAGKKVLVLSAAGSYPTDPDRARLTAAKVPLNRLVEFSGFEAEDEIAKARILNSADLGPNKSLRFKVGDQEFLGRLVDDPRDPVQGYDTLEISGPGEAQTYRLKPISAGNTIKGWSGPTRVTKGDLSANVYFRLFSLKPDGSDLFLYQRKATGIRGTENTKETEAYSEAYGGFHDDAFFDVYQKDKLGTPIYKGGDGTAEKRLLEIVRLDMEFLKRSFRYGLNRWNPDLVFHYSPMTDSAGHTWMGALDPDCPLYDPAMKEKIMPFYEQVFQLQDEWLGDMMEAAGPGSGFCLVSDHGMAGVSKYLNVNTVLEKAGLLFRTADNKIDLTKTKVCAPPWGDNMLVVNTTDWKNGIVAPADKAAVLMAAQQALLNARDPESNVAMMTRVFNPADFVGMGIGGPTGGDLYLDFEKGYYPSSRLQPQITGKTDLSIGAGVHGFWPQRKTMQAIFFLSGPGVQQGVSISGVRTIDIAPTLCRLLGIPVPSSMEGHVIGEVIKK